MTRAIRDSVGGNPDDGEHIENPLSSGVDRLGKPVSIGSREQSKRHEGVSGIFMRRVLLSSTIQL